MVGLRKTFFSVDCALFSLPRQSLTSTEHYPPGYGACLLQTWAAAQTEAFIHPVNAIEFQGQHKRWLSARDKLEKEGPAKKQRRIAMRTPRVAIGHSRGNAAEEKPAAPPSTRQSTLTTLWKVPQAGKILSPLAFLESNSDGSMVMYAASVSSRFFKQCLLPLLALY